MLLAKALALLAYLAVLELSRCPAFGLLLLAPPLGQTLPDLLLVLVLADVGDRGDRHARRGARGATRARDLLGPLLALPLLVPS